MVGVARGGRKSHVGARTLVSIVVLGALAGGGLAVAAPRADARDESSRSASSARDALHDHAVTVGSFDFAESMLLAEIYSQVLEHAGIPVRRAFDLGPREVVAPALAGGLIEFLPEYTGTALRFSSLGDVEPADDLATAAAQLAAALADADVTVLEPAAAEDANAFVVTRETAARLGLERLSDLAPVAADLVFGGPAECPSRPLCLAGLRRVYGIRFADVVELDAGGPMTKQALRSNAVDVALLFTSDPALGDGRYVALDDDRALQPAENIVPLVRSELIEAWGSDLVDAVDAVSRRLDTETLRGLNASVGDGAEPGRVARQWLRSQGLT